MPPESGTEHRAAPSTAIDASILHVIASARRAGIRRTWSGGAVEQPLAGIRAIEVGGTLAAAAATKTVSDFGADVVKVEPPGGASMRRLPPFPDDAPGLERGAFHVALDTGKRSVVLDVETPSGREVLARLGATADLVVLDAPPEAAERLLTALERCEPAPNTVVLTPHGLEEPLSGRVEDDLSLFAASSRMRHHSITGEEPLRYAPQAATVQWGATAAAAGIAAVWGRRQDGRARRIEVAGVDALLGNVDTWFLIWQFVGAEMPRQGGQSKLAYPAGGYRCADGYVTFAASNEPFFSRLCGGIGHPELTADPRFASPLVKAEHWADFMTYLGPWLESRTRDEVFTTLQAHGVMVAPILDVSEVVQDRQALARGSFVEVGTPEGGTATVAGPPFRLPEAWEARAAPRLGEHTVEVMDALGYSRSEQVALFRAGATG
ncbi:MAG: hypothetical protein GEU80_06405 [Dehalococcoidia bacterium]|nr:hypothetical protein [Dehalococcoidia bacterium]